ncbi:MAG: hypothetical protein GY719_38560 [bacterium]|nr:hypothetical protein [bacterium]
MISRLKWGAAVSWTLTVGLWMLYVARHPAPVWLSLTVAIVAVATTVALVVAKIRDAWRRGEKRRVLVLAALVVVSLAIHVIGIEHEVGDGYYHDEGTYRHHANEINNGNYLRDSFFYPHFLYYLDAFATWVASLAHEQLLAVTGWVYGISDWGVFCRLLARLITAVLAGLTAVPVYLLAERLAGMWAGCVAGLLIACSTVYNAGSHVNTSDVPSAFFAALAFHAAGRLLGGESRKGYALAGIYAGLAAGTKYPAGLVALAIIAVYLYWRVTLYRRITERRFSWGLAWAGIPSLLVFLLTTPGLALYPSISIFGDKGALFGARQYSQGGWIGVVVDSNAAYYFDLVVQSFAWPAVLLGVAGLLLLRRGQRGRALWLLPFPVLYLWLIISMNMVVERNLYPALPPIAVFLGVGIVTLAAWLGERAPAFRQWLAAGLGAVCLLPQVAAVAAQDLAYARDSTRQQAARWMHANLPYGTRIFKERYTPNLSPTAFEVGKTRWIGSYSVADLVSADLDFVVLSSDAFDRFLRPELHFEDYHREAEANYREIFERLELVAEYEPSRTRLGPRILVYEVPPVEMPARLPAMQEIAAERPFIARIRPSDEHLKRMELTTVDRWYVLRATLAAGAYRFELTGDVPGAGYLRLVDLGNRDVDLAARNDDGAFEVTVGSLGRYVLQFYLGKEIQPRTLRIHHGQTSAPGPARPTNGQEPLPDG